MSQALKVDINMRQTQVLTPLQQQSLALLALPMLDLQSYIAQEIQDYPLLEMRAAGAESLSDMVERSEFRTEDPRSMEAPARARRADSFRTQSGEDIDPFLFLGTQASFTDDLLQQVSALPISPEMQARCTYLIYSLSPRGYLQDSDEELARQMSISIEDTRQAIYAVQSLVPTGVGARDLSECLLLQLAQSRLFNRCTVNIVKHHLDDLAAGRYDKIGRALNISRQEALRWCDEVRKLNPIPSKGYRQDSYTQYIVPEATVLRTDGGLAVQMNGEAVPEVVLPPEYRELLRSTEDRSTLKFLQGSQQKAQLLGSLIVKRQSTLERLITAIVQLQPEFFYTGPAALRPMTMQQLSDLLSLHTSTVSRAVSGKYIQAPFGMVSLRSLFTAQVTGDAAVSAGSAKARLRELIRQEDRRAPLSDSDLCGLLQEQSIRISRRTVAKYRDELGIPAASRRRTAAE
jgi:RNA polymerase sigma-54 factor